MAKLSKMSRRLRRAFEMEHPAAMLDDFVVEFFAHMLEDDAEDEDARMEELTEAWSPFLLEHAAAFDNDSATREVCRAVLRRIHTSDDASGTSTPPLLSRQTSPHATVTATVSSLVSAPVAGGDLPHTSSAKSGGIEVWGLMEWLQRLSLAHYADAARAWCAELGAADVEEVIENYEEFCKELKLKPLECRRVRRDCCADPRCPAADDDPVAARPPPRSALGSLGPSGQVPSSASRAPAPAPEGLALPSSPPGNAAGDGGPPGGLVPRARAHRCERFGPADDQYTILHEIGAGVTATVYKCIRGDDVYAAKAITLSRFRLDQDFAAEIEKLHRESEILYTLRHPQIVSLYDVIQTPEKLYLVMELIDGGELFDHICRNGKLAEHEARYVFLQIALGLRYIHSKGVVHRDLKPQNILVDRKASRPGLLQVRISDFGHSKLVNDGYDTARTQVGTPRYWAPEVAEQCGIGYDQRVDLWSLGVVLYVILEGRYPFDGCDDAVEVCYQDANKPSLDARNLVQALIQVRPNERLPLDKCLAHPWVIVSGGPLSRVVDFYEDMQRSRRGERERRAVLPRDPKDVRKLRRDLQALTLRFKLPARLGRREVALCFGNATEDQVDVAWDELLKVLQKHFPGESCQRLDHCPPTVMCTTLEPVDEAAGEPTGADSQEEPSPPVPIPPALSAQDAELAELLEAASALAAATGVCGSGSGSAWVVSAALGDGPVVPRRADFRLCDGPRVLEISLQLPQGYPGRGSPELLAVTLQSSDREGSTAAEGSDRASSPVEQELHMRIETQLGSLAGMCLLDFFSWLRQDKTFMAAVGSAAVADAATPLAADLAGMPEVRCARVCLMIHHYDEKVDMHGLCTTRGQPLKRVSFYNHMRSSCAEVTGFLSFGKPGYLLAEGPLLVIEKMQAEVDKFPSWWTAQEKMFQRNKVADLASWRVFKDFAKVRTEELRELFESMDRYDLYEEVMAGTAMDPKKKVSKGKHR